MTQEEFKGMKFRAGMMFTYKGEPHELVSVNFEECLIGLDSGATEEDGQTIIRWVRCENANLSTI